MSQWCVMTFSKGHISKVKVTVHINWKTVSGPLLLTAMFYLDNISHNRSMALTQGHIAKFKVTFYTSQFFPRMITFHG